MDSFFGEQYDQSSTGALNSQSYIFKQFRNKMATATLVKVVAVNNNGEVAPVGFVDIQPMIHQVDGHGSRPTPHGIISNVPYARMQGGTNAIIMDPHVGDIGIVVFNMRDHSSVKRSRQPGLPGSFRKYSMADPLYVGACLNGTPRQILQFTDDGVNIITPGTVGVAAQGDINIQSQGKINITSGSGTFIDHKEWLPHTHTAPDHGGTTSGVN